MKLPDRVVKKEPDTYVRTFWWLTGVACVGAIALTSTMVFAQVSYFTNPDADSIVFEDTRGTTFEVTPVEPATKVSIPSGYGYDSTFSVSPGGFVVRTYEVESDD